MSTCLRRPAVGDESEALCGAGGGDVAKYGESLPLGARDAGFVTRVKMGVCVTVIVGDRLCRTLILISQGIKYS